MKKKIILIIGILLIFGISCVLVFNFNKKENKNSKPIDIKEVEEIKTQEENIIEEASTIDKSEEVATQNQPKEKENSDQGDNKQNVKSTTSNSQKQVQETPKQDEKKTQVTTQKTEQVNEQTEWEKYGMSEYDYYHKPMWSWARVDYPVETYGSLSAAHQACINAGESLGYEIISYSCININSTSGNYLGDMLKVKYPE